MNQNDRDNRDDVIEIDLVELLGVILHNLWIIIVSGVIVAAAALLVSYFIITPKYESVTKIYVINKANADTVTYSDLQAGSTLTKDYKELVKSRPVLEFKQHEALITRATMARNVIAVAKEYFKPMFDYFHRELLKRQFIMMDESPVQVLKEPNKRPQSKSYFWVTRTGEDGLNPIVLYKYTETRAGENAKKFLKGISPGFYIMADGFSGYNKLKNAKRCCCYAHIRRYFMEAIPKGHEKDFNHPAVQGVLYCNKLFEYERTYKEKNLSYTQRYKRRLKDEKPVVEAFLAWAEALDLKSSNSSSLTKAVNYVLNRKEYLFTYLEDGRCSLSNNNSENSIRPVTVGRKNWLFSDSQDGAEASMLCYTIIEMAKLYNIKIYDYILFLLSERPSMNMTDEELDKLSPWSEGIQERIQTFIDSKESQ